MTRPCVARHRCGASLEGTLNTALNALPDLRLADWAGRRVLIKANFNSPHPPPASTAPDLLTALVQRLQAAGVREIRLGDSCGLRWAPAENVFRQLGVRDLAATLGVDCVNFDDGPWRRVAVNGRDVRIAEAAFGADALVYAACLKTHRTARFSISLKHAVGFLHPDDRAALHRGDIERAIAEINLAVQPALILVDARSCFVTGGPARGWIRRPGLLLAATDRVAADVEGLRILRSFFAWNRLKRDPWAHPQIRHAVELGLGVARAADYDVVAG